MYVHRLQFPVWQCPKLVAIACAQKPDSNNHEKSRSAAFSTGVNASDAPGASDA